MAFLRRQLDDPVAAPCGRCQRCTGHVAPTTIDQELVHAAVRFLRDLDVTLPPRRQWPAGRRPGCYPDHPRDLAGRAWPRAGRGDRRRLGPLLADLLIGDQPLPHQVVEGLAQLLGRWGWEQPPTWVTFVPSRTRTTLVRDLADQAARLLGVPVHAVVQRTRPRARPQAELANSFHQYRNAHDAFAVTGSVPHSPVLLVDDVGGSGWTLTTVSEQLRDAGADAVHPLVLPSGWPTTAGAGPIGGE